MSGFCLTWPDFRIESEAASWNLRYAAGTVGFGLCLGILGRSGAGKSLFARTLAGRVANGLSVSAAPTLERCAASGEPVAVLPDDIVYVPQSPASALPAAITCTALLQEVLGWTRAERDLTQGPDYHLERVGLDPARTGPLQASQLSGGMAQRFAIALALARGPKLLLVDEPTIGLDAANAQHLIGLLRSLIRDDGWGAIIITHDSRAAAIADECLLVERSGAEVALRPGGLEHLQ